jgi:hypothetical protein
VLGLIFFHVAAFGCSTFKTDVSTYSYYGMDAGAAFRSSKQGYWKFESPMDNGKCLKYNDFDGYDFTGAWKFGRAVGVIGSLLIWALFFVVAGASFYKYPHPKLLFRVVGGVMMGLSVMSLLLLVGLSSGGGESLKIAAGGVLAILSFLVWLGGGVATMFFVKEVLVVTTAMPAQLPKPMKEPDVKPIDPPETTSRSDDATNVITTPTPTSKVAEKEGNDEEVDA